MEMLKKVLVMVVAASGLGAACAATTPEFRLSIKHDGVRVSTGEETLRYSNLWDGNADATVTIRQDGTPLAAGLKGEGERAWSVTRNGTYVLTHTTYTNGVVGKVEHATFVVTGKDIPFSTDVSVAGYEGEYDGAGHSITVSASGVADVQVRYARSANGPFASQMPLFTNVVSATTVWCELSAPGYITQTNSATVAITKRPVTLTSGSASKAYDGTALTKKSVSVSGSGWVAGEGATYTYTGTRTAVGSSANTFVYALKSGTLAGNYSITTKTGTLTVTKAMIEEEPGPGEVTEGALSKFDARYGYDGKEHTIETNVLESAFKIAVLGQCTFTYVAGADSAIPPTSGWNVVAPVYTNVGDYVVWYKVSNPNYEDFVHAAKVTVTRRPVTLQSADATWTYDTTVHAAREVAVTEGSFATGEGIVADPGSFPSITDAGTCTNAFTWTFAAGTRAANYDVTTCFGTLTVNRRPIADDVCNWDIRLDRDPMYNGLLQHAPVIQVCFVKPDGNLDHIPHALAGDTAVDAGNYTLTITGQGNYTGSTTKTWAIMPRNVKLTSGSGEWTYDGTSHSQTAVTVTGDGFVAGEGATYVGFPVLRHVADAATPVANMFTYALSGATKARNYVVTTAFGTVQMLKRPVTLTSPTKAKTYDGETLTFGASEIEITSPVATNGASAMAPGESFTFSGFETLTNNGRKNAGFTVSDGTARLDNYEITQVFGTLRVAKVAAEIRVTARSGSWVYDGTEHRLDEYDVSNPDAIVAGERLVVTFGEAGSVKNAVDGPAGDGRVENRIASVKVLNAHGSNIAANYSNLVAEPGTVTVTPRPVTVTSANISKPYDGTPLKLTAGNIVVGGEAGVLALPAGESFVYGDYAERTEAGQTRATFTIAAGPGTDLANYTITPVYGTITIAKSATEIGVTAKSRSWVYDGETHVLNEYEATNLSTLQTGDELIVTFDETSKVTTPTEGLYGDGKVANTIRSVRVIRNGVEDVTANYSIGIYPGTLAVTKRPITVTVSGCTDTITYDGMEHSVSGYDISTTDTLYNVDAMTVFKGMDLAVRTDVGTTYMDLAPGMFINRDMNFDVTYAVADGRLTIEPADITQGEDADFILTHGTDPKYNGTVQTIPVTAVTYKGLPVTYTLAGENATHAGTYTLTVKANGNFTGEKSTTWRILKRNVTLTSGSAARTYNGEPLENEAVTVTGDGFIGLEGATFDVTGSQTVAGSSKNTFTYALKAGTKVENYDVTVVEGDLVVTKAAYSGTISWNVAADAASWMYDGQVHGVALTGVPAGVTARVTGNVAKDVGSYTATATLDYDTANYVAPVAPAPLVWTITKRPLTLMAASKDKPYDGFPLEVKPGDITASGSGYAPGECFDYYNRASITDVGETPATFAYRDSATAKVSNYEVTVKGGQTLRVTVGGDQVSVTADSAAWAYDGVEHRQPTWTTFNADKLLAGHAFEVKIADTSAVTTPKDGPSGDGVVSNIFEYVRIVDAQTGANVTKNYNLVVKTGTLQVTNAWIAAGRLTGADSIAKTYDGRATNVVVTADLLQPATVRYFADGRTGRATLPEGTMLRDEPYAFTDAGTYEVWYTVEADYYNTYTGKVEVAIAKRAVTLKSPTKAKAYDGTALTFGAGEIAAEGGAAGVRALPEGESFAFSNFASITDAGRTAATFDYAAGPGTQLANYDVTVVPGTLTVNASAEEITVTAKSGNWPYDGEAHVLHACEVENDAVLKPGDELVVVYDPASTVTTPDDGEMENRIASVKIVRGGVRQPDGTLAGGTDVTRNYSVATYPGMLRVTNAAVTFGEVNPAEFSTEAIYDGETHTVAVTAPTLLTAPVTVAYCGPDDTVWKTDPNAVGARDAGAYTVRYRISAKYYDDFVGEATVTIRPRPVTLVSADAQRAYNGQPLRRDVVAVKDGSLDFVAGEGVAATCTGAITDVGGMENLFDYVFTGETKADNYSITKEYGWLRVIPAKLDAAALLGVAPVAFIWTYDGTAHAFVVVPNLDESFRIYYALKPNDEGAFAEEPPTFTDAMSEPVPVHFKIVSPNFEPFYGSGTAVVEKCPVAEPILPAKTYTGERQVADVPKSPLYAVLSNGGGVDVGTYRVRLQLVDAQNYRWESTSSSSFFAKFDIVQGSNAWTVLPTITGWTEGAAANDPVAAARFGEVVVSYCGTTADGVSVVDAPAVTQAGTYTAVFTVEASESWTGLREEVVFTVARSEGGGISAPLAYTARGYAGVYDGKGHSITLEVTGGDGLHTVVYARAETGPWQAENFVFTEACRETVWFRISSANYGEVVGTATVTITGGGTPDGPSPEEALGQLELGQLDVVDGQAVLDLKKTVKGVWYGFSGADALPGPFEPMPETFVEGTGGELKLVAPLRTPKQGFYRVRVLRKRP